MLGIIPGKEMGTYLHEFKRVSPTDSFYAMTFEKTKSNLSWLFIFFSPQGLGDREPARLGTEPTILFTTELHSQSPLRFCVEVKFVIF